MKRSLALGAALLLAGCRGPSGSKGAPATQGSAEAGCDVPDGYRGLPWDATREEVLRRNPDLKPSPKDPSVLVRPTRMVGASATEAFLFEGDRLGTVEIRYEPRRTPQESAGLALGMDKMFCAHQVTLADENRYQVAWLGSGTDIRLTYDMRESTPFGPVVSYSKRAPRPSPSPTPVPSPPPPLASPREAGKTFAAAIKAARAKGEHLALVESPRRGDLTLLYESAADATEIRLTSDPGSGKLLGAAALPAAPSGTAGQLRAEAALDKALALGPPSGMSWKSSALSGLVNLSFEGGGGWIALDPKAPDALAGSGQK